MRALPWRSSAQRVRPPHAAPQPPRSIAGMRLALLLGLMSLGVLSGCVRAQLPSTERVVASVAIEDREPAGARADDALEGLATTASPRFLGIWDGVVYDYETYDATLLARDAQRVERYYRKRGYYEAKVIATRVTDLGDRHVQVHFQVEPGEPVSVLGVQLPGLEKLPFDVALEAQQAVTLCHAGPCRRGELFDEDDFEASRKAIEAVLLNHGFAYAKVTPAAQVDLVTHTAVARFVVESGPASVYGPIHIVGLNEVPEAKVRSALQVSQGSPYSRAELQDARRALVNLGVFSSVELHEDHRDPQSAQVPVTFVVREGSLRGLRAGIGANLDQLQVSNTLRLGWEHRNFLGGLRHLEIDTRPGITYYPIRTTLLVPPSHYFLSNRLRASLQQPSFLEGRTTGMLSAEFNIFPLIFPLPADMSPEQDLVLGYREFRATAGLQRAFWQHRFLLVPSFDWQTDSPFIYKTAPGQTTLPDGLSSLIISAPQVVATLDLRDDPIAPRHGAYLTAAFQMAGHGMGGNVSDFRIRPEARGYLPLGRNLTLATRLTLGFLMPSNYGQSITSGSGLDLLQDPRDPAVVADEHKMLFRGFYSGGPTSNRGYGFREVGPHGPVGFLLQGGNVNCFAPRSDAERAQCVRPLGGLTLWETSLEVRFPIGGDLSGVTFVDASHVNRTDKLRFDAPHISPGLGLRYKTPVGPARLDLGFRLLEHVGPRPAADRLQDEAQTRPFLGIPWLPMALQVALGEAF